MTGCLRSWCWWVLICGACWAGCATEPVVDRPDLSATAASFARIVADLADPAMEGRGVGYAGLGRARDYLVEHLRGLGLEPAFTRDGEAHSYTQPIEIDLGLHVTMQSLSVLSTDCRGFDFEPGAAGAFNALGFSGDGAFEGEVVFVGYGIVAPEHGYDSYGKLDQEDLTGKVVIAYRYEPMNGDGRSRWAGKGGRLGRWSEAAALTHKGKWASQHGAAALLVVDPPSMDGRSLRPTAGTSFGQLADIPVLHLRGSAFERLLGAAGRAAPAVMRSYERRANRGPVGSDVLEGVRLRGEVRLQRPRAEIHNVAAVLRGTGQLRDQTVIVGAHYDHLGLGEIGGFGNQRILHPGADDNASGTAAVVLLARRLKRWAAESASPDRRTVLFACFSGEEQGLLGSGHLVNHPEQLVVNIEGAMAMLNFDMIGRLREDRLYVFGTSSGDRWNRLFSDASRGLRLKLKRIGCGRGASDHTSFHLKRIPSVHLFTGVHEDYHRPGDTAARINAAGGAVIVELADRVLRRLVTERARMAFLTVRRNPPTVDLRIGPGHR